MAQPSLQELRSRKRALDAELSNVRAATMMVQRTEDCKAARTAREWVLEKAAGGKGRLRCEALAVYVLADFAPEPVVVLMRAAGRQRGWDEYAKSDGQILQVVGAEFKKMDFEDILAICGESGAPFNESALRRAMACVAQWRTVIWSARQTAERHLALDAEALAVEYERARANFVGPVLPPLWLGTPVARKQGTRLRQRWGRRFAVLRPPDAVSPAVTWAKVAADWAYYAWGAMESDGWNSKFSVPESRPFFDPGRLSTLGSCM